MSEIEIELEVVDDRYLHIWPRERAPSFLSERFERYVLEEGDGFVMYVPASMVAIFPRPVFQTNGAVIDEEGDGALVVLTDLPFPMPWQGAA